MKEKPKAKNDAETFEGRGEWIRLIGSAWMSVLVSGGPIQEPYERVLQLFINPWTRGFESWTIYRHAKDGRKNGRIVYKKWDKDRDIERFRALGKKKAPMDWARNPYILERENFVTGNWVKELQLKVERLRIPPITGPVLPQSKNTNYRLRLWRGRAQSSFEWQGTGPKAWQPLVHLFESLVRELCERADVVRLT
jgi:hypothetical protein